MAIKKSSIIIVLIFISRISICQTRNTLLINNHTRKEITDSVLSLQSESIVANVDLKKILNETDIFIVPELKFKNIEDFKFKSEMKNYIDFSVVDTLSTVLFYNLRKKNCYNLVGILDRQGGKYLYFLPVFHEEYNLNKRVNASAGGQDFIFRMPYMNNIWWILSNGNLYVVDLIKKAKKIDAAKYLEKTFNKESTFIKLITQKQN